MSGILLLSFLVPNFLWAQKCDYEVTGSVKDISGAELAGATIWLDSAYGGTLSDGRGAFHIYHLCAGRYSVTIKFIGYEDEVIAIQIPRYEPIPVVLKPRTHILQDVTVIGDHIQQHGTAQTVTSLSQEELDGYKGKTLGELTQRIPGVSALMTGPSIFKPVIQGLHSQRISILNNGIRQEGQQWGIEHAPEIDTYMASEIEVVKGAETVRYGSDAMGGVVIINPSSLYKSYSRGGELNTAWMTNNRMFALSGMFEGKISKAEFWDWRFQSTVKKGGDFHAPDYNLSNTGIEEFDASLALGYRKNLKQIEFYVSSFNTELGILRSAHTGNLDDLQQSIESGRPWYIADFTYDINNPKQRINHLLFKVKASMPVGALKFNLTYGGQYNKRREYDIRRQGRSSKPSLSLDLLSHAIDFSVDHNMNKWSGSVGVNGSMKDNTNEPNLGIDPLIPDYDQYGIGFFAIEKLRKGKWLLELGARYDFQHLKVLTFDKANELMTPQFSFHYVSGSIGASYHFSEKARFISNLGFSVRPPHVSELYSKGLHHGTASIEEGLMMISGDWSTNQSLVKEEFSKKWTNTFQLAHEKLGLEISAFVNLIDNYIYLRPTETRLTIRGYFPVFQYRQTNAILSGVDASLNWFFAKEFSYSGKFSYLFASDITNDDRFLFIPPCQFENSLSFRKSSGKLKDLFITTRVQTILEQVRVPRTVYPSDVEHDDSNSNFDFMDAPGTYTLVSIETGKTLSVGKNKLQVIVSAENVFNISYRNYMNRLRYYADDAGRNIMIRLSYKFASIENEIN